MVNSRLCRYGNRQDITNDNIDLITQHLDITSAVRLAACSEELYREIDNNKGTRWGLHHWDEPCLLMPQPAHWFDEQWDEARINRVHDTVYDVVPLDHPRRTAMLPFMHDRFWVGMNGDWITAVDDRGNWCLANIYTQQQIHLPLSATCEIEHIVYPSFH